MLGLRDRIDALIEAPENADREALREEIDAIQAAIADLQHTIDAEPPTSDLSDGTIGYETVFDTRDPD